jgi:hypothetical protein
MKWYCRISRHIITPNLGQVPSCDNIEYEPYAQQIPNFLSNINFLKLICDANYVLFIN